MNRGAAVLAAGTATILVAASFFAIRHDRGAGLSPRDRAPATARGTTPTTAAPAPAPTCATGAPNSTLDDVANVLYLPSREATEPMIVNAPGSSVSGPACGAEYVRHSYIAYALSGDEVTRRLEVNGPSDGPELLGPNDLVSPRGVISTVKIGDVSARILDLGDYPDAASRLVYVTWKEPDGTWWSATTQGGTVRQIRAMVASITIADGVIRTRTLPTGYTNWAPPLTYSSREVMNRFSVSFRKPQDTDIWNLTVSDRRRPENEAPMHSKRVPVGAGFGWWTPPVDRTSTVTLNWHQDGLYFWLDSYVPSTLPLRRAIAIAQSMTKVDLTDPRFATAPTPALTR